MKIALVLSLCLSAALGIRTWIGLPATEIRELDKNWLEGKIFLGLVLLIFKLVGSKGDLAF